MAGLLKYFTRTQKKDKLDTSTLPDPGGPSSRDIPFSSIGVTNTHMHQVLQEASSERRSQEPYISLTPAQMFSIGKRVAESSITTMLHTILRPFKVWHGYIPIHFIHQVLLVRSYPFRHIAGLLICQYFTCQWNQVSPFANCLFTN